MGRGTEMQASGIAAIRLASTRGWVRAVRLGDNEPVRGIFFDEDGARAVAARLADDGYDASVVRERLAGEDDDEDHPWAVLTDAPPIALELLVDEYAGWLDEDLDEVDHRPAGSDQRSVSPGVPPLDLPSAPKRVKKP